LGSLLGEESTPLGFELPNGVLEFDIFGLPGGVVGGEEPSDWGGIEAALAGPDNEEEEQEEEGELPGEVGLAWGVKKLGMLLKVSPFMVGD
jgi:hypothetical protein